MTPAWFENLKVGDSVAIFERGTPRRATVERVTTTQFVAGGVRFTARGWEVGAGVYGRAHASPWTPELEASLARSQRSAEQSEALRRLAHRLTSMASAVQLEAGRAGDDRADLIEQLRAAVDGAEDLVRALQRTTAD